MTNDELWENGYKNYELRFTYDDPDDPQSMFVEKFIVIGCEMSDTLFGTAFKLLIDKDTSNFIQDHSYSWGVVSEAVEYDVYMAFGNRIRKLTPIELLAVNS